MDCEPDELWKGQLEAELTLLEALGRQIDLVESKLDSLAAQEPRTSRLRTIPGVGPRLSEAVVAWIMRQHNPHAAALYNKLNKGEKTRRKQATVALGRRLLTWCWAMLRDETTWDAHKVGIAV